MDTSLIARLRILLRKSWETWSAVQDREDDVFRAETGIDHSPEHTETGIGAQGCDTTSGEKKLPSSEIPALSDLVKQRNEESKRSSTGEDNA